MERALYWASTNAKLLAYRAFCLPHVEYAAAAWDPSNRKGVIDLGQLQDQTVQFIAGIRWSDGVEYAKTRLELIQLHKKGKTNC